MPLRDTLHIGSAQPTPCSFLLGDSFGHPPHVIAGWAVGDFDGDSWDELVTAGQQQNIPGNTALVWFDYPNGTAQTARQINLHDFREMVGGYRGDLDGDGAQEVAVAFKRDSEAWSALYGRRGDLVYRTPVVTGPDLHPTGEWDGHVTPLRATDLTRDGRRELIASVTAAYDRAPRGLIAYDIERNAELWSFPCGSPIEDIGLLSHPATGERLLLVSTVAVMNGAEAGGFSDQYSYLLLLGSDGRLIHQRSWGGEGAKLRFAIADLDADAMPEAVVGINSNFQLPTATYGLAIIDPFSFTIERQSDPGVFLDRPLVCDLNGDGAPEIVSSRGNAIYVFDDQLALIREIHCEGRITELATWDMTGDGSKELLVLEHGGDRVALVDAGGRLVAATPPRGESLVDLAVLRWGPRKHLLYTFSDHRGYACRLEAGLAAGPDGLDPRAATQESTGRDPGEAPPWGLLVTLAVAGALLAGLGGYALARRRRAPAGPGSRSPARAEATSDERAAEEDQPAVPELWLRSERDSALRTALALLTTFGHGEAGAALGWAATILQAANDERVADADWREQAEEACLRLHEDVRPLLMTTLAHERVLAEHGAPPRELIRRYDGLIEQSEALRRVLNSRSEIEADIARHVGEDLRRFDRYLRALRGRLRASFRCDLPLVLGAVLAARRRGRTHHGPRALTITTEQGIIARIDPVRMRYEVLEDLIANAVRAMEHSEQQHLTIRILRAGEWVRLQIGDTGCGIAPENHDAVFQQGFSTKDDGSGLGLFRARRTVKEFGGQIYVEDSSPGKGTVITVELRAAEPVVDTLPSPGEQASRQGEPARREPSREAER